MVKQTIPRRPSRLAAPLSFAQQRLWFLAQLEPKGYVYNSPSAWRLAGPLNIETIERSLVAISSRHETLRTNFILQDASPIQVIRESQWMELAIADLTGAPASDRQAELERMLCEEARCPFDLARDPMLRARLFRLGQNDHVLLCTVHHIAIDGWSWTVFFEEFATLYNAYSGQRPVVLPELLIQYADYAAWQREYLQGEVLQRQLVYWKERLKGDSGLLNLPLDRPRPTVQSYAGARRSALLPKSLVAKLRALSQRQRATLFMTMLAAWQTLLYRYTNQQSIAIGVPTASRKHMETEQLIGFFVNTLVMRADLSENPTFSELLARVSQLSLEAYQNDELPFEKLVEELHPDRHLDYSPLFQVMFAFQNLPKSSAEMNGLKVTAVAVDAKIARFDLTLFVLNEAETVETVFEYNTDLFDAATMERMLGHYQALLEGIVAHPDQRIAQLPLLSAAEKHQLLVAWNDTQTDYPKDKCLHELFEEQAKKTPDAIALVWADQQLSYRELNSRASQLAHYLQKCGVGPDVLVGICVERSFEMIIGLFGILKAGGAYVPLDPSFPQERLAFMLGDSQVRVLLCQEKLLSTIDHPKVVCLDRDWHRIDQETPDNPRSDVRAENLAYVIYTSGSTGAPKGVMIAHRGLVNYLCWASSAYGAATAQGAPVHSSIGFDLSVTSLFAPLMVGQRVVLLPEDHAVQALSALLSRPNDFSLIKVTPAHLAVLGRDLRVDTLSQCTRALIIGGEALTFEPLALWAKYAPATRLINEYGPTESVVGCCVYEIHPGTLASGSVPIGRPIANTQIYILDGHLQPVPIGVTGELHIGGMGLARGYLNRPELTAERFICHSFDGEPAQRLYRTGDLARYLPDGNIEFLGRADNQVKLRGYRIELGEIESVLAQHRGVRKSIVIVREDSVGDKQLVAYVVAENFVPTASELRTYLKAKLPDYMVPGFFVMLECLPLTSNGKVDRSALPAPDRDVADSPRVYVGPRTPAEKTVAGTWEEVLGRTQIGMHDNFFELGGHSLKGTQVVSRLRKVFQSEIPLRYLFEFPTIAELTAAIDSKARAELKNDNVAELLTEIEVMPEEEARRLLAGKSIPNR